jgi:hypothetical protein
MLNFLSNFIDVFLVMLFFSVIVYKILHGVTRYRSKMITHYNHSHTPNINAELIAKIFFGKSC